MLVIFPYYQLSIGYSLFKWFRRCYSKCTQIISEATFLEKYFSFVWRLMLQVVWIFQATFDLSNILQLFMSKEEFLSHRNSHCSRRISCQTCAANFPRVQTLISHLIEVRHGEVDCSVCSFAAKSQKDLELHLKRHADVMDKPYFCSHCDGRFSTRKVSSSTFDLVGYSCSKLVHAGAIYQVSLYLSHAKTFSFFIWPNFKWQYQILNVMPPTFYLCNFYQILNVMQPNSFQSKKKVLL